MKYIIVLGDGMADEPVDSLGGRTPLEAAFKPGMERLAARGEVGLVRTVPDGMNPGSDTANLAVLGYDPRIYYSGRSSLEALSIGVDMDETDVSLRCNLVTLSEGRSRYEDRVITDHSSGEISTGDAAVLIDALSKGIGREGYEFHVGTGYRHLLICKDAAVPELVPPHDILTRRIGPYLPGDKILRKMMEDSYGILSSHPLNIRRREAGLNPANSAWFWGPGRKPKLTSFRGKTGKRGVMIAAVDLLKGIAVGAGMDVADVEGANGGLDTDYAGKMRAARDALLSSGYDFAYVHVEAPDEMGHQGRLSDKIKAIENIDREIVAPLTCSLEKAGEDYRMLVLPDHPTPLRLRTHTGDPVPYLLYDSTRRLGFAGTYDEKTARENGIFVAEGYRLIDRLLDEE